MKRISIFVVSLLLCLQMSAESLYFCNAPAAIKVRSAASVDGQQIGVLNPNETIVVVSISGDWATVKWQNHIGFVAKKYLVPIEPAPENESPAQAAPSSSSSETNKTATDKQENDKEKFVSETKASNKLVAMPIELSDSVEVLFVTNVPANLSLNGEDYGEVSVKPYRLKYGQYVVKLSADNYFTRKKRIEPLRTSQSIYTIKLFRQPKRYDVRMGLQQEVNLNYGYHFGWRWHWLNSMSGLVDYMAGYRFNDWVFLGAGTGLHVYDYYKPYCSSFNVSINSVAYQFVSPNDPSTYSYDYFWLYATRSVEIPLYAQLKVYCMNTRWKPYMMASLGARFGLNKYKDIGVLFNLGPGVEFNITRNYAVNFAFCYEMQGHNFWVVNNSESFDNCVKMCPYYGQDHYHVRAFADKLILHGMNLRVGFVF